MNKTMKKLGLLMVAAIALTMGVNSANALRVGSETITADTTVYDAAGNTVTVDETNATSFVITVNGPYADAITVAAGEYVTINLNGKTLAGNVTSSGNLTINGNGLMTGALSAAHGTLTINGGNYAYLTGYTNGGTIKINGIGTVLKAGMEGDTNTALYKAVAKDGYYVLAEADANYGALVAAIDVARPYVERETATPGTYTVASYKPFVAAYNEAMALAATNVAGKVLPISQQATITALANKLTVLNTQLAGKADYSAVDAAINKAVADVAVANSVGTVFTDASIKKLNNAIANANAAANRDLPEARQAEVAAMAAAITDAENNLKVKANYSKINDLESVIAGLKAEQYTTETWTVLTYVRNTIERDLDVSNQGRVNYFYNQLLDAVKGLKRSANQTINNGGVNNGGTTNPGTTVNPGTTNNGGSTTTPGTVVNPNTNASGTTGVVDTGDNVATYAVMNIVSLIALAGCGLVLRKQN